MSQTAKPESELGIGSILAGQFRILARLGAGGMGELYLADQFAVDRKVAIKVVHAGLAQLHPSMLERFKREARSLAQVSHPNVVHLYAFGETDRGNPFLAMEFVPGSALDAELAKGPMLLERALKIALQVANALCETHRHDVVHRDLKPANIMLKAGADGADIVKLVDFGIAKTLDEPGKLTQPGALFGTPQYMPPEQARGLSVDGRSDIYALGTVLYEMLTGASPFPAKTPYDFIAQHLTVQPDPPSRKRLHVPAAVDAIVLQCLEKEPEKRFATADALAAALESALAGAKSGAVPSPSAARVPASAPIPVATYVPLADDDEDQRDDGIALSGARPIVSAKSSQPSAAFEFGRGVVRMLRFWPWAIWLFAILYVLPRAIFPTLLATLSSVTQRDTQPSESSQSAAKDSSPSWIAYAGAALGTERDAVAGYAIHCLNRFTPRAVASYARYLSWADPERGPSGSAARGVYDLADPSFCLGHIRQSQLAAPEPFRKPADVYAGALAELATQLNTADGYYGTEAFKDDALQKGHALHAPLMRAFFAYVAADRSLRALITERLEQSRISSASSPLERTRVAARHLAMLALAAGSDPSRVDATVFATELELLANATADLERGPARANECNSTSSVHTPARQLVVAAKQFSRTLRTRPPKLAPERDADAWLPARSGTLAALVDKANAVLRAYNACTMSRGEPVELELVQLPAARLVPR